MLKRPIELEREFLHVTLDVPASKTDTFERKVSAVLPLFEGDELAGSHAAKSATMKKLELGKRGFGWQLTCAARFPLEIGGQRYFRYVHLWRIPSPPNLGTAMYWLATDRDYAELHQCVDSETQNIAHLEDMYSPSSLPAEPVRSIFHETFELKPDRTLVTQFQWWMPWLAADMKKRFGWQLIVALQNETGKLGTRVHMWSIPPGDNAKAIAFLDAHPLYVQSIRLHEREGVTLEAVDYVRSIEAQARDSAPRLAAE